MSLFFERRTFYTNMTWLVPRQLQRSFNDVMERSGTFDCLPASENQFLVVSGCDEYTVDLASRYCSCGEFKDFKWPCVHASSAITRAGKSFMDYVEHYYKKQTLESVYAGIVHPVPIGALPFDGLLPPITRAQAGRPKKVRMRNRSELQSEESPIICSLCNERGHNKRTCQRRRRGERVERR
jgi:predicted nucleic acid-binding Zn finger protein